MIIDVAFGILLAIAILTFSGALLSAIWFSVAKFLQWCNLWKGIPAIQQSKVAFEAEMKAEGVTYRDLEKILRWDEAMRRYVQEGAPEPPPWHQC